MINLEESDFSISDWIPCMFLIIDSVYKLRSPSPPNRCDPYRRVIGHVRLLPILAIAVGIMFASILSYWLELKQADVKEYISFGMK